MNVIINWGKLVEQDKCLAINVPFTDEQQQMLLGKTREEKHKIIQIWREEYAEESGEKIIKESLHLDNKTENTDPIENPEQTGNPEDTEDIKILRARYKELLWKWVPPAKINDIEFIKNAIAEAEALDNQGATDPTNSGEESEENTGTESTGTENTDPIE